MRVKHGAKELTLGDCESRAPLVPQDVQTDAAVRVDVGVVDASGEVDLWRLERVVGREVNVQEENAARVWRVALPEQSAKQCNDSQRPKINLQDP